MKGKKPSNPNSSLRTGWLFMKFQDLQMTASGLGVLLIIWSLFLYKQESCKEMTNAAVQYTSIVFSLQVTVWQEGEAQAEHVDYASFSFPLGCISQIFSRPCIAYVWEFFSLLRVDLSLQISH